MSRVLLVNMPFSSLRWPALGISLLQAELQREGIDCDLAYLNFDLAETIGLEAYEWINDSLGFVLGGERLFAKTLFGSSLSSDRNTPRRSFWRPIPSFSPEDQQVFDRVGEQLEAFLDDCLMKIDWSRYTVVGFTTTFQQTMASLALASRIKQLDPRITICLGGANCEGVMGRTLLERFPQIDLVFSGEADETFPARCAGAHRRSADSAMLRHPGPRSASHRDTCRRSCLRPGRGSGSSSLPRIRRLLPAARAGVR